MQTTNPSSRHPTEQELGDHHRGPREVRAKVGKEQQPPSARLDGSKNGLGVVLTRIFGYFLTGTTLMRQVPMFVLHAMEENRLAATTRAVA